MTESKGRRNVSGPIRTTCTEDRTIDKDTATTCRAGTRVDWVDYAKGICIIMVVMMHSTLGVEKAAGREGWMHAFVDVRSPFRMPDFFLISGLFLAR